MACQTPNIRTFWATVIGLPIVVNIIGLGFYLWVGQALYKKIVPEFEIKVFVAKLSLEKSAEKRELVNDLELRTRDLGNSHLRLVGQMFLYLYLALLCSMISGALTAVSAFLVVQNGWGESPGWIKATFLAASATTAFWLAVPQVFKYEENIASNENLYRQYANLHTRLRMDIVIPKIENKKVMDLDKSIRDAIETFNKLRGVSLAFDPSKAKYPELSMKSAK